jgi:Glycosyl hydrolases family 15
MENAIALSARELAINPSLYALMRLGFTDEAADYMTWREARCREAAHDRGLQVLYTIDRNPQVPETTPDHLDRYTGSRPVRVGNSAAGQLQLDVDGGLMDSPYLFTSDRLRAVGGAGPVARHPGLHRADIPGYRDDRGGRARLVRHPVHPEVPAGHLRVRTGRHPLAQPGHRVRLRPGHGPIPAVQPLLLSLDIRPPRRDFARMSRDEDSGTA